MTTFLDTCIVISLLSEDDPNHVWSVQKLQERKLAGPTLISDVVYSEISIAMDSARNVDLVIKTLGIERVSPQAEELFRAGRAFKKYKMENNGPKLGVLPDFFIGAAAETENSPLITNNKRDYIGYFPNLVLIVPTPA